MAWDTNRTETGLPTTETLVPGSPERGTWRCPVRKKTRPLAQSSCSRVEDLSLGITVTLCTSAYKRHPCLGALLVQEGQHLRGVEVASEELQEGAQGHGAPAKPWWHLQLRVAASAGPFPAAGGGSGRCCRPALPSPWLHTNTLPANSSSSGGKPARQARCCWLLTPTVHKATDARDSSTLITPWGRNGTEVGALAEGSWSPLHHQHHARLGGNKR